MKNTIISVLVVAVILGGLIWLARPDASSNVEVPESANGAVLASEASNFDFGTISMAQGNVTYQFKIKNTSEKEVKIDKVYTSCMCTVATLVTQGGQFGPFGMPGHGSIPRINGLVEPGEEVEVAVVFDPAAHGPAGVGRVARSIILENDAGEPVELQFSATVTP